MKVYIVGEDDVTCAIIKRILLYCSEGFEIISELPARGGQIKSKINEFNKLAAVYPVILLTDLDATSCAPQLLHHLTPKDKHNQFIFNIAVDEGEAWLMADRYGFAEFAGVDIESIPRARPTRQGGRKALIEMCFAYKPSRFLTHELIKKSKKPDIIKQLTPKEGASKGPEYNTDLLPFIQKKWDIDEASKNSDSLTRMVNRIRSLITSYETALPKP
ncbi:MAG: hypothetical protein BGP01_13600 [Paludibacter sp. 47-17]|nr:MAG: hypothetical protein BGP01_13600 [Paludibacter sp. 47-17]